MPHLTLSDGESLYYEEHGAGKPLLLVSGLGGVASFWKPHVAILSEHYRVILHDHRGTGASSKSLIDYSVTQMTDDLLQLMDHLEIARADFVGHSTGGAIGQTMALDFPEHDPGVPAARGDAAPHPGNPEIQPPRGAGQYHRALPGDRRPR